MNKPLTEHQKQFLFDNFFEQQEYAGWKSIANNLLEKGSCVVAGSTCIWIGGIGNFMKISPAPEPSIGCVNTNSTSMLFCKVNYINTEGTCTYQR